MRVLFVGDTHGNEMWWARVVLPVAAGVAAEAIAQVGDFGFWSHGGVSRFVGAVASSPVPVFFIDGNHENHPALAAAACRPGSSPVWGT